MAGLRALRRAGGESIEDYYLRIDEPLALAFRSAHTVGCNGEGVRMDCTYLSWFFLCDIFRFYTSGLHKDIQLNVSRPPKIILF